MNLTELVAVVGMMALLVMAVCVGAELDIEGQRRERQRLAEERRRRNEGRQRGFVRRGGPLCERCPYRDEA